MKKNDKKNIRFVPLLPESVNGATKIPTFSPRAELPQTDHNNLEAFNNIWFPLIEIMFICRSDVKAPGSCIFLVSLRKKKMPQRFIFLFDF